MSGRPTITAAIIALNEETHLAELLPTLDWVDQIVVVDGGSRDGTIRVAESHGCRVVLRGFDTFARQRNHALRLARCDWILSIDADERPTSRLADEIHRRIADSRATAYRVPIRSTIFGRPFRRCGTQDDRPIRLFRREMAQWSGDVHETLRVKGRVGRLDNWLTHNTIPDLATFLAKVHRYTHLAAQARVDAGQSPSRLEPWLAPPYEILRRLVYKQGFLDGPAGWAFCFLSGLSEWILAQEHRRLAEHCATEGSQVS